MNVIECVCNLLCVYVETSILTGDHLRSDVRPAKSHVIYMSVSKSAAQAAASEGEGGFNLLLSTKYRESFHNMRRMVL